MSAAPTYRRRTVWLTVAGVGFVLAMVARVPVTTLQGVNFEVTAHRLPLYLKTFEFLDRDAQYRNLAAEVTRGAASDQQRALAIYEWTIHRIQPAPDAWQILDDHILNIIIRGYGTSDQRADVFATLVTYAGVPAFWQHLQVPDTNDALLLTFVQIDGRWVVFDVANRLIFWNVQGQLASLEDLRDGRATVPAAAQKIFVKTTLYSQVITQLRMPAIPRPLRAELQMPWPRLWDSSKRAVGLERDNGSQR